MSDWLKDREETSKTESEQPQTKPVIINVNRNVKRRHKHQNTQQNANLNKEGYALPFEMRPVVEAILAYGKKTNAIGNLGAAQILLDIANNLRKLGLDKTNNAIKDLIENAERQAAHIKMQFEVAYDELDKSNVV